MTAFEVWAPAASRVDLVLDGARIPMVTDGPSGADADGRWSVEVAGDHRGLRYGFSLDGADPLPDPRARMLPDGPLGLGQVVALEHEWRDDGWQPPPWHGAVVVEIHVGTFTPEGTFRAAADRLRPLVELGVTHVELMPITPFSGHHGWGYDGVSWWGVHAPYGTPDDLSALVDAAHGHGLGVLLDVVHNHFGPEGVALDRFGPYRTDRHSTPWGDAVNLDGPGSDAVRREICESACTWLRDHHIDGLRLDATHALRDDRAVHLLDELRAAVRHLGTELGRPFVLIAENDRSDPRIVRTPAAGGHGLDAVWADDLHHAIHAVVTGERLGYYEDFGAAEQVADVVRHGVAFRDTWSPHRGRRHGADHDEVGDDALVVALQNHDQVGNRAAGERLASSVGFEGQMAAAALVLTSPSAVLLLQGEDWAASTPFPYFADHTDPELVAAVRAGRLEEFAAFGWGPDVVADPEDEATFRSAVLRWEELDLEPHATVRRWYRDLLAVRRRHLRPSRHAAVAAVEGDAVVVVERGDLLTVANLGSTNHRFEPTGWDAASALTTPSARRGTAGAWHLEPRSAVVLERR